MAALYGWLDRDEYAKRVTRTANRVISSCVRTWRGQVEVFLGKTGDCSVTLKSVPGGRATCLWSGNIDTIWDEPTQKPTMRIELKDGKVFYKAPEWLTVVFVDHDLEESHDGPE